MDGERLRLPVHRAEICDSRRRTIPERIVERLQWKEAERCFTVGTGPGISRDDRLGPGSDPRGSVSTGASQLSLVRATLPPGHVTPVHLHEIDEEVVHVLEGELTAILEGEEQTVGPGGTVFVPPGTWMALANRTDRPVVVVGALPRGELERCYRVLFSRDADEADRREAVELCRIENR